MQQRPYTAVFFDAATRPDLADSLFRLRYALFVQELGWSLPADSGRERDQFDTGDAVYCGLFHDGQMVGCFRAIGCERPYLAQTLFSHMATRRPYPAGADHVEISRFGVLAAHRQASTALYSLLMRFAKARNAVALVALAELPHERLLNRIGLPTLRYGDAQVVGFRDDGARILAVAGEIPILREPSPAFRALLSLTQFMEISDEASLFGCERLSA
ncbi:acyl-homoserine-lactone synthase [Bradyrhizobium japonicum]|uniref:acyl-homoserine-lactone synthase n=1 Tax=Bradyrhizobium japonicum TaxID=375 RepID=UPI00200D80CB|nr:acyl-homoserine-lactone synthase [Bradyrhizobium japonicum]UQE03621.1 GNAT family N-acetyltransferase [Bradyrhizobium japonicum]